MSPGERGPGRLERVPVEPLGSQPYEVLIGAGVLPGLIPRLPSLLGADPGRLLVVLDAGVPEATAGPVLDAVRAQGYDARTVTIEPCERDKSLETFGTLLGEMASHRIDRRGGVLAVGGGIVGDVAGFAASAYRRGVAVVQCPTTLLAAVDASVGGKTGMNLSLEGGDLLKNMAGAFHQPRAVFADVATFASLPERVYRSGLAECLKHGMLAGGWADAALHDDTRAWMPRLVERERDALIELVTRNVAVKARVVAADEREELDTGGRAVLNLGHTYAHAMESLPGLAAESVTPPLLHGEAVGLGLIAATACAAAMGRVEADAVDGVDGVRRLVGEAGLPVRVSGLPDDDALIERMGHDKKSAGGRLRLTLPGPGFTAELVADPPLEAVRAGWVSIRS